MIFLYQSTSNNQGNIQKKFYKVISCVSGFIAVFIFVEPPVLESFKLKTLFARDILPLKENIA